MFGKADLTFNRVGSGFDALVYSIIYQGAKIIIGGDFTSCNNSPCLSKLVRLNSDGSLDASFNSGGTGLNGAVYSLVLQQDNKIVVGGAFTTYNGSTCPKYLIRLDANGKLDLSFNNGNDGFDQVVRTLVIHPTNGNILVGGDFTTYNGSACPNHLVRINASDGSLDLSFNNGGSGFNFSVFSLIAHPAGGNITVGGDFTTYNGSACPNRLARINSSGLLVSSFNNEGAGFDQVIYSIVLQKDGKVIAGGNLTSYNGSACSNRLARINPDGTLDSTFNYGGSGFDSSVRAITIQPDRKIIVGGDFTTYNESSGRSNKMTRLNLNGTLDPTFNSGGSGFNSSVYALALYFSGRLIVGGDFVLYNGKFFGKIVRLNAFVLAFSDTLGGENFSMGSV